MLPLEMNDSQNNVPSGTILLSETVAGQSLLADVWKGLNVGESTLIPVVSIDPAIFANRTTEIQKYVTHIERLPNDGPIKVFRLQWQWNHQKQSAVMKIDGGGIPIYYQEGSRSFLRIR